MRRHSPPHGHVMEITTSSPEDRAGAEPPRQTQGRVQPNEQAEPCLVQLRLANVDV